MTKKKQIIISLCSVILLLAILSFSYFLISVSNQQNEKVISKTGTMSVVYTDCTESANDCANINKDLKPGESVTKTFRVENTGTVSSGFEIIFKSLTNTFVDNELVYEIYDEFDNIIVSEKPVPHGTLEGTTIFSDNVMKNNSKSYKMIVTFKELDKDQNANKNASYNIELGIKSSLTVVAQGTFTKLQSLNNDLKINSVTPNYANISPMPSRFGDNGFTGAEKSWTPPVNTSYITYGDGYIFNETTGSYTLINPKNCRWNECFSELTDKYYCYNALYTDFSLYNYSNRGSLYKITSNSTDKVVYYLENSKEVLDYDYTDTGLFQTEDDYGESLYFRGDVTNNYVKFGKNKSGQDMYWRILRINGNGTLRIEYDGTEAHENGDASVNRVIGPSKFNNFEYDNGYIGFMYGNFPEPTGCDCTSLSTYGTCIYTCIGGGSTSYEQAQSNINDSAIKKYLETWYIENIFETGYADNISDDLFCNDRNVSSGGYGSLSTRYFARIRLSSSNNPTLNCNQKNDAFTVNDSIRGNTKLKYPIGLISADELVLSGMVYNGPANRKVYTFHGNYYSWTMSPNAFTNGRTDYIYQTNTLGGGLSVTNTYYVIPVINLNSDYVQTFTGNGTINNPFHGS